MEQVPPAAYSDAMGSQGGSKLRFSACWGISALVLFGLMVTWSFATPLGAASDEPTHIIKAAAVARGEFLGSPTDGQGKAQVGHEGRAVMTVRVPASYSEDPILASCYRHRPKTTAKCAPSPTTSDRLVVTTTYVGRYPPLYYVIVGLPTRYLHSGGGIYFMRVLSSLASALLLGLALAVSATWSRSRFVTAGIALAATPMVVFLGGVIKAALKSPVSSRPSTATRSGWTGVSTRLPWFWKLVATHPDAGPPRPGRGLHRLLRMVDRAMGPAPVLRPHRAGLGDWCGAGNARSDSAG
jgi:hypothetical protein